MSFDCASIYSRMAASCRTNGTVGRFLQRVQNDGPLVYGECLGGIQEAVGRGTHLSTVPAAMQNHHAFLGGLLEHTLSVTKLAISFSNHYPEIKRDLLITGVILHDIGKTRELSCERSFQYTDEGQLTGHLASGIVIIYEKALKIENFPPDLLNILFHLVLSHHGEYEWGSPVKPGIPEAIALHHLDNLDAKIQAATRAIVEHKDTNSLWTDYVKMFERRLYKK